MRVTGGHSHAVPSTKTAVATVMQPQGFSAATSSAGPSADSLLDAITMVPTQVPVVIPNPEDGAQPLAPTVEDRKLTEHVSQARLESQLSSPI